jgi:hypothetical protein
MAFGFLLLGRRDKSIRPPCAARRVKNERSKKAVEPALVQGYLNIDVLDERGKLRIEAISGDGGPAWGHVRVIRIVSIRAKLRFGLSRTVHELCTSRTSEREAAPRFVENIKNAKQRMESLEGANALAKQVLSQAMAGKYKVHRCGLPLDHFS